MVAARSSLPAPAVPDGWAVRRFGDVGTIVTGGTPPTADPANYGADYLFVSPGDINDGKYVVSTEKMLSRKGWELARHVPKSSVLFVCIGSTIGKCGLAAIELSTNQQINAICPSPAFSADFIYYAACLAAPRVRAIAAEQAVPIVNKSLFASTEIVFPPIAEQKAIAAALSDVDALLGALDQFIAKKRDLKQAAMQQLLTGQTRMPGFIGKWQRVAVGELFAFKNGLNKAKEFFGHGTPIVNYMDVYQGTGLSPAKLPGRVEVSADEAKAFEVRRGDVFFTRTSETVEEIGLAAVMVEDCQRTVFSGFLLRGRPKNDWLRDAFKRYCFRSEAVRRQIISGASYTTRALTNGRLLSAVLLDVPSREEQTAIAGVLSDMDAEILALEQRRDKTRLLKEGMMQELLTGRTRLT